MLMNYELKYEKITGESAKHIPIVEIGAFLDGYDMATEKYEDILNKIRADVWDLQYFDEEKDMIDADCADAYNYAIEQVIEIIDKTIMKRILIENLNIKGE